MVDRCLALGFPDSLRCAAEEIAKVCVVTFPSPSGYYLRHKISGSVESPRIAATTRNRDVLEGVITIFMNAAKKADVLPSIRPSLRTLVTAWLRLHSYDRAGYLRELPEDFSAALAKMRDRWTQDCQCPCCSSVRNFLCAEPYEAVLRLASLAPEIQSNLQIYLERYCTPEMGEWTFASDGLWVRSWNTGVDADLPIVQLAQEIVSTVPTMELRAIQE